ncbi:hypothetical protein DY000_02054712 [Brassica cretica]|uniref:MLO-like protein n=1 Tax=Brassica cretica TaxID=69181 RepID=A0ABQ7A8C4_BRACR|nr:hypothetical protein DY000_02054712 [Brassica cretica]
MADPFKGKEKSLEETATWAVAVVCFVLIVISLFIERLIHKIGTWLKQKHKGSLYEALEKVKAVAQTPISKICIPKSAASSMRPCSPTLAESYIPRRSLATKGYNECPKGKVPFVSAYGIHQLHIFIFVLAVVHVIYCIVTYALGKSKISKWKQWEDDTKTVEYKFSNDQDRFRLAKDTSFRRRHLSSWSNTNVTLWTVCFFRQFFGSVTEVDYKTLRLGFIAAHFAPGSGSEKMPYDFFNYIQRTLEKDFKTVVEISPVIWFVTLIFLLTNSDGNTHWLLPLKHTISLHHKTDIGYHLKQEYVVLIVGTKLQVIITKLGLRIQEKSDVVRGAPVVQPGDDLFWFDNPNVMLFLIHLVLFIVRRLNIPVNPLSVFLSP